MHQVKITSLCYVLHNMSHINFSFSRMERNTKTQVPLLFQTNTPPVTLSLPLFVCPDSPKIATTPTAHKSLYIPLYTNTSSLIILPYHGKIIVFHYLFCIQVLCVLG